MTAPERKYLVASDVGGTCTDTIVFAAESVHIGKALSTPPKISPTASWLRSVRRRPDGLSIETLLAEASPFMHGSTVVDNTVLTRDGARTGLITTAGFEDTLLVTRGAYGRWARPDRGRHQASGQDRPRRRRWSTPDCIVGVPRARRLRRRGRRDARRGDAEQRDPAIWSRTSRSRRSPSACSGRSTIPPRAAACASWSSAIAPRCLCHAVQRHRAGARRIRAHVDHGHQRLCRPHHPRLSRRARGAARSGNGYRGPPHGHAGLWRPAAGGRGRASAPSA